MLEHPAPLFRQGGDISDEILLLGNGELQDQLDFLPGRGATEGGQAKRDTIRVAGLSGAMPLAGSE